MVFTDQIKQRVVLKRPPQRIISLVPSLSELLVDLDLTEELIGVTKFCIHPASLRKEKTIIGGTKNLRFEVIDRLNPDLIIANKEENRKDDILRLMNLCPVYTSDVSSLEDTLQLVKQLGYITHREKTAAELCNKLEETRLEIIRNNPLKKEISALYLIWKKPFMAAGTDTYISRLMELMNIKNVLTQWGEKGKRYPAVDEESIQNLNPNLIILSTEPYPFKVQDTEELSRSFDIPVVLANGEIFSWYGSRLLKTFPELVLFLEALKRKVD